MPEPEPARLTYLEVREPPGDEVATTIEILSYVNKRPGPGRRQYEEKRLEVLSSFTNLVEIDLAARSPADGGAADRWRRSERYRILVSRADQRPRAVLFAFSVGSRSRLICCPCAQANLNPGRSQILLDGIYERAKPIAGESTTASRPIRATRGRRRVGLGDSARTGPTVDVIRHPPRRRRRPPDSRVPQRFCFDSSAAS
jgi:hypothetical protein